MQLMSLTSKRFFTIVAGTAALIVSAAPLSQAQNAARRHITLEQYLVEHPECALFGPQRDQFLAAGKENHRLSALTSQVTSRLSSASGSASTAKLSERAADNQATSSNLINSISLGLPMLLLSHFYGLAVAGAAACAGASGGVMRPFWGRAPASTGN